jgi:hypothetical protein
VLAGIGDAAHQLGRRLQVPVGIGDMRVAQVGRQRQHVAGNGITPAAAALKRLERKVMPQIMNPRRALIGS